MNLEIPNIHNSIAKWSFFVLFPGFFFYHSAVGLSVFPSVLGGFFSPMSVLLFPLLALAYLRTMVRSKLNLTWIDQIFFIYVGFFLLVICLQYIDAAPVELLKQHMASVVHLLCCFFIFKMTDFEARSFRIIALVCFIAMTLLIFQLSVDGTFYLRQDAEDGTGVASYQGFARSYMVTAIALVAFIQKLRHRILIYAIAIPSLYLAVARSEFAAFFVFAAIFEIAGAKRPAATILTVVVVALALYASLDVLSSLLPENRVLELLMSNESTSGDARDEYTVAAIQTIKDYPILGAYGSYIHVTGIGSEAHNILSAWVDIGLFGMLLFSWMLARTQWQLLKLSLNRDVRAVNAFKLALCLLLMTIFLLLTAKDFTYMLVGASLGICSAYMAYRRRERRSEEQAFPTAIWQQAA